MRMAFGLVMLLLFGIVGIALAVLSVMLDMQGAPIETIRIIAIPAMLMLLSCEIWIRLVIGKTNKKENEYAG